MIDVTLNINTYEYLPLRDVVYNTLKEAILTGVLVPAYTSITSMSTIIAHHRNSIRAIENHDEEEGVSIAQGHIKYQTDSILQCMKNR